MTKPKQHKWYLMDDRKRSAVLSLWASGGRIRHIARALGVKDGSVRFYLKQEGIDPKERFKAMHIKPSVIKFLKAKKSTGDVAALCNCSVSYVRQIKQQLR